MLSDEQKSIINSFIKKGEDFKELGNLEFNGKTYKEIVFLKKGLKLFGSGPAGYIYIDSDSDSDNKVVNSKNVIKELSRLAYFSEAFFSSEKGKGILASLQSKDDVQSDRIEFEEISRGLDFLKEEKIEGTDKVKHVVKKLPDLKEIIDKGSKKLEEAIDKYRDRPFGEDSLKVIYPLYEDILRLNFENVKFISSLSDVCDNVQVEAEKKRKKWANRVKKNVVGRLMRVSDKIAYFKRVIRTYGDVVNMTTPQYLKFLSDMNKDKIEARSNLVRS